MSANAEMRTKKQLNCDQPYRTRGAVFFIVAPLIFNRIQFNDIRIKRVTGLYSRAGQLTTDVRRSAKVKTLVSTRVAATPIVSEV